MRMGPVGHSEWTLKFGRCVFFVSLFQKVLLNLTVLCITWALCHGFCIRYGHRAEFINGKTVAPTECTDPYDKTKHPFGSTWNTEHCMRCDCSTSGMGCCSRYGGIVDVPGCTPVRDPDTCTYKFFDSNNPQNPCWYTGKEPHMSLVSPARQGPPATAGLPFPGRPLPPVDSAAGPGLPPPLSSRDPVSSRAAAVLRGRAGPFAFGLRAAAELAAQAGPGSLGGPPEAEAATGSRLLPSSAAGGPQCPLGSHPAHCPSPMPSPPPPPGPREARLPQLMSEARDLVELDVFPAVQQLLIRKRKLLFSLALFCLALPLSHAGCFTTLFNPELKDGIWVFPDGCADPYDRTQHPVGSMWNSAHCKRCVCGRGEMECCDRFGGIAHYAGCGGFVDPETCRYKFYRLDDPSKLCGVN
ncbi:uncharacterized protein LOC128333819 [Hemicordylus capensis]|uniref:uncharacterized protein LOC128333819 n=1 Tax=Hemicordylus capensis TaxID=884348 RepID=UPI002303941F|nr:uncharacterized protein LOC128333819 [Hemicordylus capensis]